MTTYLVPFKRPQRPPLPDLTADFPSAAMRAAARTYVKSIESNAELLRIDCETLATDRPGLEPQTCITDLQYAYLVLAQPEAYDSHSETAHFNSLGSATADCVSTPDPALVQAQANALTRVAAGEFAARTPTRIGSLELRTGYSLMNSQLLRSSFFRAPPLDHWLRPIGDGAFRFKVSGFSPSDDHFRVMLFALTLLSGKVDFAVGAAVEFTTRELIDALGWTRNGQTYKRVATVISELKRVRLTFEAEIDKRTQQVVSDAPLFSYVVEDRVDGLTRVWRAVLTPALFALFGLNRNSVLEMRACRALVRNDFVLWLYGLIGSQKPGERRMFDVAALCKAGGLGAARPVDNRKTLAAALKTLQAGMVGKRGFEPIVEGWTMERDGRRWALQVTRTAAFYKPIGMGKGQSASGTRNGDARRSAVLEQTSASK